MTGACLTVTEFSTTEHGGWFKVGLAPETLKRTNLQTAQVGQRVNCERAMSGHTRFGGHQVQGHVDTVATLLSLAPTGNALTLTLRLAPVAGLPAPALCAPYLIPKGFITLNGASLTLIDVSPAGGGALTPAQRQLTPEAFEADKAAHAPPADAAQTIEFTVMLIAHTQAVIDLPGLRPGDLVNVEFDMAGKYVVRSVQGALAASASDSASPESHAHGQASNTSLERLVERVVRKVLAEQQR